MKKEECKEDYRKEQDAYDNSDDLVEKIRTAAEQGEAEAQYFMGICYYLGVGMEENLSQAVKWLRTAAEQGEAKAQYELGVCYEEGEGVKRNLKEAVKWYREAAGQGHEEAVESLKRLTWAKTKQKGMLCLAALFLIVSVFFLYRRNESLVMMNAVDAEKQVQTEVSKENTEKEAQPKVNTENAEKQVQTEVSKENTEKEAQLKADTENAGQIAFEEKQAVSEAEKESVKSDDGEPCEQCLALDIGEVVNENPYFFPSVGEYEYEVIGNALFDFKGVTANEAYWSQPVGSEEYLSLEECEQLYSERKVGLLVKAHRKFENGILYSLQLTGVSKDCYIYSSQPYRLHLGYFYVTAEQIYWLEEYACCVCQVSEEEFVSMATLVCQKEMEESITAEEDGWQEQIYSHDRRRIYRGWDTLVESGYYLHYEWEIGKGLTDYWSGWGSGRENMQIQAVDKREEGDFAE